MDCFESTWPLYFSCYSGHQSLYHWSDPFSNFRVAYPQNERKFTYFTQPFFCFQFQRLFCSPFLLLYQSLCCQGLKATRRLKGTLTTVLVFPTFIHLASGSRIFSIMSQIEHYSNNYASSLSFVIKKSLKNDISFR